MFDLISIGDATLDTFVKITDASVNCQLNTNICQLCLNYADKIPIERLDRSIAGNAANNAVGSARLGMKTAIYTIVGKDETGKLLFQTLKKEGVGCNYVHIDPKHPSNYSVVINFQGERTILVHHEPRMYKLPKLDKAGWVYYTSVGKNHSNLRADIERYIRNGVAELAYNPGTHQLKEGLESMRSILSITKILFVNKEEAILLLQVPEKTPARQLLKKLFNVGPAIVVITDGKNGSYAFDGMRYYQMSAYPAKLVEMTGAGDSFATAFMAAMFYKKGIDEALRWGATNSASVIEHIGPQAGLLTLKEMQKRMKRCPTCVVKPLS